MNLVGFKSQVVENEPSIPKLSSIIRSSGGTGPRRGWQRCLCAAVLASDQMGGSG
ncbi:hypothetical protein PC115_g12567 [Phytophthora cactorum]|uniref:Uncharacterized protein n=1 Tax=Phytophthora cactorum TaxID=29920 RepID=A0A8T1C2R1_9STRA|nr:hypothetical protein PC115_g12567 [Phytophthora cactorum]KAG2961983.1 hypothetical protein PC120_g27747 [Phytophthora cactorum]KAG3120677.1 hypothetical protein C6341_g27328 [Phytophthora cactorum]